MKFSEMLQTHATILAPSLHLHLLNNFYIYQFDHIYEIQQNVANTCNHFVLNIAHSLHFHLLNNSYIFQFDTNYSWNSVIYCKEMQPICSKDNTIIHFHLLNTIYLNYLKTHKTKLLFTRKQIPK